MENDTLAFIRSCIAEGKVFWTYHVNMAFKGAPSPVSRSHCFRYL